MGVVVVAVMYLWFGALFVVIGYTILRVIIECLIDIGRSFLGKPMKNRGLPQNRRRVMPPYKWNGGYDDDHHHHHHS